MLLSSFHSARRRARHLGAAALALTFASIASLALSGCGTTFPEPVPPATSASLINGGKDGLLIPLHVERSDEGHARLGLPVQVDGKPLYVEFDTGTHGLRVLKSALPGKDYAAAGGRSSLLLPNDAEIAGASVKLPFSVAGAQATQIAAQSVDTVHCQPGARHCVAMDGYTGEFGWAFSGVVGVGAPQPDDSCCAQPLRALPGNIGQRYLVRANIDRPYLVLSPSSAITKNYTMVPMTKSANGDAQWPRGCVNVDNRMTFCAPLVFSTGSSGMIRIETDKAPDWTGDDDAGKILKQGNYQTAIGSGGWVHRYESAQVTIVKAKPDANRIVIGLMGMQNIDLLFDFPNAQVGLHAANQTERFAP
ncbi:hypothetical protein P3T18_002606 [Paraburkholderia sp. GAS199]|uniref:hypothetical protein n=1 Tax=Paraburkholderia sp. GAS199 TaxID=3035126 RepID=UPI003D1ADC22